MKRGITSIVFLVLVLLTLSPPDQTWAQPQQQSPHPISSLDELVSETGAQFTNIVGSHIALRIIAPMFSARLTTLGTVLSSNFYTPASPPSLDDEPTQTPYIGAPTHSATTTQSISTSAKERYTFDVCTQRDTSTSSSSSAEMLTCVQQAALGDPDSFLLNASKAATEGRGWFGDSHLGWLGSSVAFPYSVQIKNATTNVTVEVWKTSKRRSVVIAAAWKTTKYNYCSKVANENRDFKLSVTQYVYYHCMPTTSTNCYKGKYIRKRIGRYKNFKCAWWAFGKDPCRGTHKHCYVLQPRTKLVRQPNQCMHFSLVEDAAADAVNRLDMPTGKTTLSAEDITTLRSRLGADRGAPCSQLENTYMTGLNSVVPVVRVVATAFAQDKDMDMERNLNDIGGWWSLGDRTGIGKLGWKTGTLAVSSPKLTYSGGQIYTSTSLSGDQLSYLLQQLLVLNGKRWSVADSHENVCVVLYERTTGDIVAVAGKRRGAAVPNVMTLCAGAISQLLQLDYSNSTNLNADPWSGAPSLSVLLRNLEKNSTATGLLEPDATSGASQPFLLQDINVTITGGGGGELLDVSVSRYVANLSGAIFDALSNATEVLGGSGGSSPKQPLVLPKLALLAAAISSTATPSNSVSRDKTSSGSPSTTASVPLSSSHSASLHSTKSTTESEESSPSMSISESPVLTPQPTVFRNDTTTSPETTKANSPGGTGSGDVASPKVSSDSSSRVVITTVAGSSAESVATASASTALVTASVSPAVASNWVRVNSLVGVLTCSYSPDDEEDALEPATIEHPVQMSFGSGPMRKYAGVAVTTSVIFVIAPLVGLVVAFRVVSRGGGAAAGGEEQEHGLLRVVPVDAQEDDDGSESSDNTISSVSHSGDNSSSDSTKAAKSAATRRRLLEVLSIFNAMTVGYFFPVAIGACGMVLAHPDMVTGSDAGFVFVVVVIVLLVDVAAFSALVAHVLAPSIFDKFAKAVKVDAADGVVEVGTDGNASSPHSDTNTDTSSSTKSSSTSSSSSSHSPPQPQQQQNGSGAIVWVDRKPAVPYNACFAAFFDSCGIKARRKVARIFFFEDVLASAAVLVLSSIRPPDPGSCSKIAGAMSVVSLFHIIYLFKTRPFESTVEFAFAAIHAVAQLLVSLLAIAATSKNDSQPENPSTTVLAIGWLVLIDASLFFIQAFVLAGIAYFRYQRRRMIALITGNDDLGVGATTANNSASLPSSELQAPLLHQQRQNADTELTIHGSKSNPLKS